MATLGEFLADVAKDTAKLDALKKNPDKAMTDAGLSDADKAIVRSGDPGKIRAAVAGTFQPADNVVVVVVVL